MKKLLKLTIVCGVVLSFGACSSSQTTTPEENIDAGIPPATDAATDAVPAETPEETAEVAVDEPPADPFATVTPEPAPEAEQSAAVEPSPAGNGTYEDYTVQAGDTLMKVAFETYGDLYRWKGLLEANKDKVTDPNHIPAGTVLKIEKPSVAVTIEKNGDKYLIKSGDTLGTISKDVYGTQSKWKTLWENNKQLIHDPNRIFAGFYLYYQPDGVPAQDTTVTPAPMAESESMPADSTTAADDAGRAPGSADAPPASAPADTAAAPVTPDAG